MLARRHTGCRMHDRGGTESYCFDMPGYPCSRPDKADPRHTRWGCLLHTFGSRCNRHYTSPRGNHHSPSDSHWEPPEHPRSSAPPWSSASCRRSPWWSCPPPWCPTLARCPSRASWWRTSWRWRRPRHPRSCRPSLARYRPRSRTPTPLGSSSRREAQSRWCRRRPQTRSQTRPPSHRPPRYRGCKPPVRTSQRRDHARLQCSRWSVGSKGR